MLTEGQIIDDKYEIIRILGRGGTGTVYLARHMALKLERAVKEICREDCPDYEEIRQSLLREAYILKNLPYKLIWLFLICLAAASYYVVLLLIEVIEFVRLDV